ncbi:hypothetical protein SRHO_G00313920 [Serrasalmus rhombeus]
MADRLCQREALPLNRLGVTYVRSRGGDGPNESTAEACEHRSLARREAILDMLQHCLSCCLIEDDFRLQKHVWFKGTCELVKLYRSDQEGRKSDFE